MDEEILALSPEIEDISTDVISDPLLDTLPTSNEITPVFTSCEDITLGQYFGTLQDSVLRIWKYHLTTSKHFEHVELEHLYNAMLNLTDKLIEEYQGVTNSIIHQDIYSSIISTVQPTCLIYLQDLRQIISTGRQILFSKDLTELWSTIDEILSEIDRTLYKLKTFDNEPAVKTFESFCKSKYHSLNENCCEQCDEDDEEE